MAAILPVIVFGWALITRLKTENRTRLTRLSQQQGRVVSSSQIALRQAGRVDY
jgi:hypothetical protein